MITFCPPSQRRSAPTLPAAKPDIGLFLGFGLDKKAILLSVVNNSEAVIREPSFFEVIWDLDADDYHQPLQIPSQTDKDGYIRPSEGWEPYNATEAQSEKRVKSGHRLFGLISIRCPLCIATRVYWVYAVMGSNGWYAEADQKHYPSLQLLAQHMQDLRANPESIINALEPYMKPKTTIGPAY